MIKSLSENRRSFFEEIYHCIVYGFFLIILVFLTFLCAFCTCQLDGTYTEVTYFLPDSPLLNLSVFLAVLILLTILKRLPASSRFLTRLEQDDQLFRSLHRTLLGILFGLSLLWVLSTQRRAGADQLNIQNTAYWFKLGDYSAFFKEGYLARYPNQIGLVLISWLFSLVFGSHNYTVFQIFNALFLTGFYSELSKLCELFGQKRSIRLSVLLTGILFFPLIIYCSFVYGNLGGQYFAVLAFRLEVQYFRKGRTLCAVLAAAFAALAVLLKMNYLIFWIGLLIYAAVEILRNRKASQLILPVLLLGFLWIQSVLPLMIVRSVTSEPLDQGCSSLAWVAMGLQQDSARAPGWYNKYNINSYRENGYNKQAQAEAAKESIRSSLSYFLHNKRDAIRFFTKKTASQWCNPDFQGFWVFQVQTSAVEVSEWVWRLISIDGERTANVFLNLLEFLILCGSLLWCVFSWKERGDFAASVFPMIFIGGFLFHLVWEAKSQYTVSYYVLLFPCAVSGYSRCTDCLAELRKAHRAEKSCVPAYPCAVLLLSALLIATVFRGHTSFFTSDREKYEERFASLSIRSYVESCVTPLYSSSGQSLAFQKDGESLLLSDESAREIWISSYCGRSSIHFEKNGLYLTAKETASEEPPGLVLLPADQKPDQRWVIKKSGDSGCTILYGEDYFLCYDESVGTVFLSPVSAGNSQVWYFEQE